MLPLHLETNIGQKYLLQRWANFERGLYGEPVYLVGSALREDNNDPRDWDIIIILPDEIFALRYGKGRIAEFIVKTFAEELDNGKWSDIMWKWSDDCVHQSRQGMKHTHLLIDFKVWPESYDKKEFKDKPKVQLDTRLRT